MQSTSLPNPSEAKPEVQRSEAQPACPVCSGMLIVLRGLFRCARCGYCTCSSCEGAGPDFAE
jgi:hypothetical protein